MADVEFKISSGLKSIIGRDLITNDFVAIFVVRFKRFEILGAREIVDEHLKKGLDTDVLGGATDDKRSEGARENANAEGLMDFVRGEFLAIEEFLEESVVGFGDFFRNRVMELKDFGSLIGIDFRFNAFFAIEDVRLKVDCIGKAIEVGIMT